MATEKETVILDLKVDQGSAINELERTKKSIIQLKEEQKQLTEAYKKGNVTLDEYASESVRLEAILKKQTATYSNVQKSVTGVKTSMDKLLDSTKSAASEINVAGVSVGGLTQKLASFANPATAAVGIVTALGAAYARSTIGAKDLEFASNELSAATTILTNSFAKLISSTEDGQGLVSKFVGGLLFQLSPKLAIAANVSAMAIENMQQVQREAGLVQANINARLAENADLRTDISNQDLDAAVRLNAAQRVLDNITQNTNEKLESINKLIDARNQIVEDAEVKENAINLLISERSALTAAEARDKSKIDKQVNAIVRAEEKRTAELQKQQAIQDKRINRGLTGTDSTEFGDQSAEGKLAKEVDVTRTALDRIAGYREQQREKERQAQDEATQEFIADQETRLLAASAAAQALTTLAVTAFGQNSEIAKATGITEAIVNTYTGATLALRSTPPPLSFALAALTIANGLASVNQITRAAGGGDFVTKGPVLMIVGDNPGGRERVTVEPLSGRGQTRVNGNRIAMAGGGSLTTGFDDGGIVRNGATAQMQQAIMFSNAIKSLPSPKVGVDEIVTVMNRVQVKQSVASA